MIRSTRVIWICCYYIFWRCRWFERLCFGCANLLRIEKLQHVFQRWSLLLLLLLLFVVWYIFRVLDVCRRKNKLWTVFENVLIMCFKFNVNYCNLNILSSILLHVRFSPPDTCGPSGIQFTISNFIHITSYLT